MSFGVSLPQEGLNGTATPHYFVPGTYIIFVGVVSPVHVPSNEA